MILLLDNNDSFTYNLYDYFLQLGAEVEVRNCQDSFKDIANRNYSGVVLSPGPGRPEDSGCLMECVKFFHSKLPMLGICLGHQAIGQFFGSELVKAIKPMHGKISKVVHNNSSLYQEIPSPTEVVRYHSLILKSLPEALSLTGKTDQGEIMSFEHKNLSITGIQFHPEAYLTQAGLKMLQNWLTFNKLVN